MQKVINKRIICALLLYCVSYVQLIAQENISIEQIRDFLAEEGYVPKLTDKNSLNFKKDGKPYTIKITNTGYVAIYSKDIYCGNIDEDPMLFSEAMLRINQKYYGLQLFRMDDYRNVRTEMSMQYKDIDHFNKLFYSDIKNLEDGMKSFQEEREALNKKGFFFTNVYWSPIDSKNNNTDFVRGKFNKICLKIRIYSSKNQRLDLHVSLKNKNALLDINSSKLSLELKPGNHVYTVTVAEKSVNEWEVGKYEGKLTVGDEIINHVTINVK